MLVLEKVCDKLPLTLWQIALRRSCFFKSYPCLLTLFYLVWQSKNLSTSHGSVMAETAVINHKKRKKARESSSQTTSLRRHIVSPGTKTYAVSVRWPDQKIWWHPTEHDGICEIHVAKYAEIFGLTLRKPVRIYGRHWRVSRGRKCFLSPWRGCRRWKRLWIFSLFIKRAHSPSRGLYSVHINPYSFPSLSGYRTGLRSFGLVKQRNHQSVCHAFIRIPVSVS